MANWAQKPGGWNCRRGRVAGIAAGAGWLELSPGYLGGVIPQRPLVIPEVFAADPVEGQDDQPGHRLLAPPGAGQRQGEERRDRVMAGTLLVSAPHNLYSLIETPEVAQGAAVLDQAPAQAVAVQARGEGSRARDHPSGQPPTLARSRRSARTCWPSLRLLVWLDCWSHTSRADRSNGAPSMPSATMRRGRTRIQEGLNRNGAPRRLPISSPPSV